MTAYGEDLMAVASRAGDQAALAVDAEGARLPARGDRLVVGEALLDPVEALVDGDFAGGLVASFDESQLDVLAALAHLVVECLDPGEVAGVAVDEQDRGVDAHLAGVVGA